MQPIVTAAEMQALDRATIDELGIPAFTLMETAGRALSRAVLAALGELGEIGEPGELGEPGDRAGAATRRAVDRSVTRAANVTCAVVCGPGNNGADGFVAARVLRAAGVNATVVLVAARASVTGDAAAHLAVYERAGGQVHAVTTAADAAMIASSTIVVDALFGIGLARPIAGIQREVIAAMARAAYVVACDLPSGLAADTGAILGTVARANRTIAMGALKVALVSSPGFIECGRVEVAAIGIEPAAIRRAAHAWLVEESDVAGWLPRGTELDHKGHRGHVLVVGGAPAMRGAGRLAAVAALRAGAGLVTLAGDGEVTAPDSVMTRTLAPGAFAGGANVDDGADGAADPGAAALASALAGKHAVVIGPGLNQGAFAAARVAQVLAAGVPAVIDADALNGLASRPDAIAAAAGPVIITPHPAEAARLLGCTTAEVEADRLAAARRLAAVTRAVVVLKGARTIVCDGGECYLNPTGGPALATAGSGDVLAGVIAALLAQRLGALDAARAGVYLHGAAGDALGAALARGTMSSDLPLAVAHALAGLAARIPAIASPRTTDCVRRDA